MASADTMSYQDAMDSQYLSSSLSSLSQSRSTNSLIVRAYKQATQFYLTKRFKDALDTLEPIISPRRADGDVSSANPEDRANAGPAPIAQSSRGTRTKVWVFYLTLVHGIVDLGQEEGKTEFGSGRWKALASKVREGRIWEDVVQHGYGGSEGDVDADVVVNLATLLLGHMQNQRLNQQRLESYLAASDMGGINGHLSWAQDGISTPMSNTSSSPKMLATRLKILELYTLHVLPANDEWDYSQSFIEMNDMLDEERREAFLQALQTLKEEKDGTAKRERELKEQRERETEQQRKEEEAQRAEAARAQEAQRRAAADAERQRAMQAKSSLNGTASTSKSQSGPSAPSGPRAATPTKKPPPASSPTFYRRASAALGHLQHMVLQAGRNMNFTSVALLRLLVFMLAFLLLIARQDLRAKLRRVAGDGWRKVKQTVGMGVKVSYI